MIAIMGPLLLLAAAVVAAAAAANGSRQMPHVSQHAGASANRPRRLHAGGGAGHRTTCPSAHLNADSRALCAVREIVLRPLGLHRLPIGEFPLLRSLASVLASYDGAAELERALPRVADD